MFSLSFRASIVALTLADAKVADCRKYGKLNKFMTCEECEVGLQCTAEDLSGACTSAKGCNSVDCLSSEPGSKCIPAVNAANGECFKGATCMAKGFTGICNQQRCLYHCTKLGEGRCKRCEFFKECVAEGKVGRCTEDGVCAHDCSFFEPNTNCRNGTTFCARSGDVCMSEQGEGVCEAGQCMRTTGPSAPGANNAFAMGLSTLAGALVILQL